MTNPIKQIREKMKLNQAEFAKLVGTKQSAICLWESGQRYPLRKSFLKLLRLAKKFELENAFISYIEKE